ncbi:MAG: PilZ domain-containing protein [Armatimonadetes bacterium]|nr:PilZ domain-containing protein [Armatimonadota bacterium]
MDTLDRFESTRKQSMDTPERRRHTRVHLGIPVTLFCPGGTIEGITVNESYTGILVQVFDGELPDVGERCKVELRIMGDTVDAVGEIVRLQPDDHQVAVELLQLGQNGVLLLALFPPL